MPLLALNFFMADMQAGIGPFLGVFLLAHGWQSGWIGTVMTARRRRRHADDDAGRRADRRDTQQTSLSSSFPASCTVIASGHRSAFAEFLAGRRVAGRDRDRRCGDRTGGRRHHARHRSSGRVQPAERPQPGLQSCRQHGRRRPVGLLGWQFGFSGGVWLLAALFGVLSIISVLMIPRRRDRRRRGTRPGNDEGKDDAMRAASPCCSNASRC